MGKASRAKAERQAGVLLEEVEARRLLTAQNNEMQARLNLRAAVDALASEEQAKAAVFAAIAKAHGIDPTKVYILDDETLRLTVQASVP